MTIVGRLPARLKLVKVGRMVSKLDRIKGEIALWARLRLNRSTKLEKLELHLCFVFNCCFLSKKYTGYDIGACVRGSDCCTCFSFLIILESICVEATSVSNGLARLNRRTKTIKKVDTVRGWMVTEVSISGVRFRIDRVENRSSSYVLITRTR